MAKKTYPRWTILSILALLITLVLAFCFDKMLWHFILENLILPSLINALADIVIPIAVVLLFWIIPKANGENKIAPIFFIFAWLLLLLFPTILSAFPARIEYSLGHWFPFNTWNSTVHLHFPNSRFHFVSGFALSIGIIGASDRLRGLIFRKEPRVTKRKFPLRTVLSICALAAVFILTLFLNDLLRWAFDNTLFKISFFEFFVIGTLINTILPIMVILLFWSAYKASAESNFASFVFSAIGIFFVLLPIVLSAIPSLNRIRLLWYLPFLPAHSLLDLNAPFSILYYSLGFVLVIGIIGVSPRIQNFLFRKDTNGGGEHDLLDKEQIEPKSAN